MEFSGFHALDASRFRLDYVIYKYQLALASISISRVEKEEYI